MFFRDSLGIYRSEALSALPWLDHGFGTRYADPHPSPLTLRQIHSDWVVRANSAVQCEGDALLSNEPALALAVRTADCVPILLADIRNRVVAAVHAGWRGTAKEIVRKAVERMAEEFATRPGDLQVAIGPAIGRCCYEVGPEVATALKAPPNSANGRSRVDLAETNRSQISAAGVPDTQIQVAHLCTSCLREDFFSYRRDKGLAGRMHSAIVIR